MKKNFLLFILTGIVCLACGYEDNVPGPSSESKIISLFSRGTPAPDSSEKIPERTFQQKDSIGLYLVNPASSLDKERYAENVPFVWRDNQFTTATRLYYPEDSSPLDFLAYYPYRTEGISPGSSLLPVEVAVDQRSETAFLRSDFMTAYKKSVEPSQEDVNLVFFHRFSRLDIALKPGKLYDMESLKNAIITLSVKGVYTSAFYQEENKEFTAPDGLSDISPYTDVVVTEDSLSGWSVIIIPQTIKAGKSFIEVTVNGKDYFFAYEADRTFEGDKRVKLTLTLESETGLEIKDTEISDWSETVYEEGGLKPQAPPKVETKEMDFSRSLIWYISSSEQILGAVCREYLCREEFKYIGVTYYPWVDGSLDYSRGEVLFLIDGDSKLGGGDLVWKEEENAFDYSPDNGNPVTSFYITSNGRITTDSAKGVSFTLSPYLVKDIDDNDYGVVKIGKQLWMMSNLRTSFLRDGTSLKLITNKFDLNIAGYRLHSSGNDLGYGYYYNSPVLSTAITPVGWKISASTDWLSLKNYLGGVLSLKGGELWEHGFGNETGFTVFPGGYVSNTGNLMQEKEAYFLCTDDNYYIIIGQGDELKRGTLKAEIQGFHIRCLKE